MELNIDRSNWKKVKLGDVAFEYSKRVNNPSESEYKRFVGSANIGQWDFRIKSWDNANSVTSTMKAFEPNDYLLVRRSLYASDFRERAPRATFSGICSGDIITIKENPEFISDGFLIIVLNHPELWKYVVANASGSITRRIKWKNLANYEFLLPPKEQQAQLAELLWAMDEVVEKENKVLKKVLIVKDAKSKELLLGQNEKFQVRQKSPYGEIPTSWDLVKLFDLRDLSDKYSFTGGPFGSDLKSEHYTNKGIRVLQLQNIGQGEFLNHYSIYTSTEKADQLISCNVYPNDILLAKMSPVARCCLVPNFQSRYVMCSDGIRLSVDKSLFDNKFIYHALNSNHFRHYVETKSIGTTRARISLKDLKLIPLPIPSSLKEQELIAKELDCIDMVRDQLKQKIQSSKALQSSLINQIF